MAQDDKEVTQWKDSPVDTIVGGAFACPSISRTAQLSMKESDMELASRIDMPADVDTRNLDSVIDSALTDRVRKPTLRGVIRGAFGLSLVAGISVLVIETESQRRKIEKMQESQETTLGFIKTLIDETTCGQEAYTYLQMVADDNAEQGEDQDDVVSWSDDAPVPYDLTDKGEQAVVYGPPSP